MQAGWARLRRGQGLFTPVSNGGSRTRCGVGKSWNVAGEAGRKLDQKLGKMQISSTNHHNFPMSAFEDEPEEPPLLFQPNPSEVGLLESLHNIPRYLFRLYGPTTAGTTTEREVTSPAWTLRNPSAQHQKQDLFQQDPPHAGGRLYNHLKWEPSHEATCNLMSWTSSLLFAIQYGLYRRGQRNGYPSCDLQDLYILVVDTKEFPAGTFIRDMELINNFRSAWRPLREIQEWRTRSIQRLYFGEYLTQGSLDVQGHCTQVSLFNLIDNGLLPVPGLGDRKYWHLWARRVVELRESFENSDSPSATAKSDIRKAIVIAERCFGLRWTLPMALMLLSLRPRPPDDPIIVGGLLALFTGRSRTLGADLLEMPC